MSSHSAPTIPIGLSRPSAYLAFSIMRRAEKWRHILVNRLCRYDLHLAGEYFSGNLGDISMGRVLQREGRAMGLRPGLGEYDGAWHRPCRLVMGGGELGDEAHFTRAFALAGTPERVSACGIAPVHRFRDLPAPLLGAIARMPYISTRSSAGTRMMREVLGRPDVEFNPDIAFALHDPAASRSPAVPVRPRLGINLMTFYVLVEGRRRFAPDLTMKPLVADRSFAPLIDTAGERFVHVMRALAGDALRRGWEVVNIPFSAVDAMFADAVLGDLDVRRLPYAGDARTALRQLASCSKFVATRFHAHIFGLIAGVPTVSIAYSGKCQHLWRDLCLEDRQQVPRLEVCLDPGGTVEKLRAWDGLTLPQETLAKLAADARAAGRKALAAAAAA